MARTIPASFPLKYQARAGRKVVDGDAGSASGLLATGQASNYALAKLGLKQQILCYRPTPWSACDTTLQVPISILAAYGSESYWKFEVTPSWQYLVVRFYTYVDDLDDACQIKIYSRSDSVTTDVTNVALDWISADDDLGVSDVGTEEVYLELISTGPGSTVYLYAVSAWEEPRSSF